MKDLYKNWLRTKGMRTEDVQHIGKQAHGMGKQLSCGHGFKPECGALPEPANTSHRLDWIRLH